MADKTKRNLVQECIKRRTLNALKIRSAEMSNRDHAEVVRLNVDMLASGVAGHLCDTYEFLELSDLFDGKRKRIRR